MPAALELALEAAGYDELRRSRPRRRARGDVAPARHRAGLLRRDHRRRRRVGRVQGERHGRGPPGRQRHDPDRHLAARAGPRRPRGRCWPARSSASRSRGSRSSGATPTWSPRAAAPAARAACSRAAPRSGRRPRSCSTWPGSGPPTRSRPTPPTWSLDRDRVAFTVAGAPGPRCRWPSWPRRSGCSCAPSSPRPARRSRSARTSRWSRWTPRPARPTLQRLIAVDDAGVILNPLLAEGQRHGGIAQGAAQALLEEVVYDADGNPLTASFADYPFLSATEVPMFELVDMETPTTLQPARCQGDRRGRHDRRHPGRAERGRRRGRPPRRPAHRHADHLPRGSGRRSSPPTERSL